MIEIHPGFIKIAPEHRYSRRRYHQLRRKWVILWGLCSSRLVKLLVQFSYHVFGVLIMWKLASIVGIASALIFISSNANAQAYKWTNPAGNIIYSQTPPPIGTPFELVDDRSIASTNYGVSSTKDLESGLDASRQSREDKKAEQQKLAESEQIIKENCTQAKTNLTALTSRGQVTIKEGELYRKLTEEERQERIQQANASIGEFCI